MRGGWIVTARDETGFQWKAARRPWLDLTTLDLSNLNRSPRLLTHAAILGVVGSSFGLTVASAQSAPQAPRLAYQVLAATTPGSISADIGDPARNRPLPPVLAVAAAPAPAPTLKPAPTHAPVAYTGSVADIIRAAAARYGVDPNWMLRVANCESHLNPNSYNASSGATGLFQFKPATFYGHGGHNIWDPADQADVAARMFSQGLAHEWSCR